MASGIRRLIVPSVPMTPTRPVLVTFKAAWAPGCDDANNQHIQARAQSGQGKSVLAILQATSKSSLLSLEAEIERFPVKSG